MARQPKVPRELLGQRFGLLTVTGVGRYVFRTGFLIECLCDCGTRVESQCRRLIRGYAWSCGCAVRARRVKHGLSNSPTYTSWRSMIQRCSNPGTRSYETYGGAGVAVCNRWVKSFQDFLADMGIRPSGTSIDRIDNSKGYEPGNCRWATVKEQARNKKRLVRYAAFGREQTAVEWAEETGINRDTLVDRIRKGGWSVEKALTTPVRRAS